MPASDRTVGRWWWLVLGFVLVALALRLGPLGQSIFGDELFLYRIVNGHGVGEILRLVRAEEKTPPLGFLLARVFAGIGDGTVWVRIPSLLAGLASIPLLVALGTRLVSRRAGLLAGALLAVSPFEVFYSTESRSYAQAQCFCLAAILALLHARERDTVRSWAGWVVFAALALYSHYIAVLVLVPAALWVLARPRRAARGSQLAAHAAVLVLFVPWIPSFLEQARHSDTEGKFLDSVAPSTAEVIGRLVGRALTGHPFLDVSEVPTAVALVVAALVVLGAATLWLLRRVRNEPGTPPFPVLAAVLAFVPLLAVIVYSARPDTSFLLARNVIVAVPFALLVVAAAVTSLPGRAMPVAGLVVLAVGFGALRAREPRFQKPDARRMAAHIDRIAPARTILINGQLIPVDAPPAKGVATYLERRLPTATAATYAATWPRAAAARRPVLLYVPGGRSYLDAFKVPDAVKDRFRPVQTFFTPGLGGGYSMRLWLPR